MHEASCVLHRSLSARRTPGAALHLERYYRLMFGVFSTCPTRTAFKMLCKKGSSRCSITSGGTPSKVLSKAGCVASWSSRTLMPSVAGMRQGKSWRGSSFEPVDEEWRLEDDDEVDDVNVHDVLEAMEQLTLSTAPCSTSTFSTTWGTKRLHLAWASALEPRSPIRKGEAKHSKHSVDLKSPLTPCPTSIHSTTNCAKPSRF